METEIISLFFTNFSVIYKGNTKPDAQRHKGTEAKRK